MTTLFFVRRFYPQIGGVETHVFQIGKRLVSKGFNVLVVTERSNEPGEKDFEEVQGMTVYRISGGNENWLKKFLIWRQIYRLRGLIYTADIIHCHDVFFWYLPFRFIYPQKSVFTTFHGYETKYPPEKKAIFIRKISEKLSWGNICVGDYIKKWYKTKANFVTYGGVDLVKSQVFQGKKINKKLRIVFVGRLEKDTGCEVYLKVLEIFKKKKISFHFQIYGDGTQKKQFEKYGYIKGLTRDVQSAIANSDIVFVSSYLSILEAMMQRKLVVSVYENLLKKDYLMLAPFSKWILIGDSSNTIEEKITYYLNHRKEKNVLIENAFTWAQKATWDKVLFIYIKLWNQKK